MNRDHLSIHSKTLAGLSLFFFGPTGATLAQSTKGIDSSSKPSVSKSLPKAEKVGGDGVIEDWSHPKHLKSWTLTGSFKTATIKASGSAAWAGAASKNILVAHSGPGRAYSPSFVLDGKAQSISYEIGALSDTGSNFLILQSETEKGWQDKTVIKQPASSKVAAGEVSIKDLAGKFRLVMATSKGGMIAGQFRVQQAPTSTPVLPKEASIQSIDPGNTLASYIETARKQVDQNAHKVKSPLDKYVAKQFAACGSALGVDPKYLENPRISNHSTFICALTDRWMYRVDLSGNQTFRPISNVPHLISSFDSPYKTSGQEADSGKLTQIASNLSSKLGCSRVVSLNQVVIKKEILVAGECGSGKSQFYNGRYLVRLRQREGDRYFQVVCDENYSPIRLDTNVQSPAINKNALKSLLQIPDRMPLSEGQSSLKLGAFFDPAEYRFKIDAKSYLGEAFLDPKMSANSFGRDNFDLKNSNFVDVEKYRNSQDYKFWCSVFWDLYGRVGGAQGNFDAKNGVWEKSWIQPTFFPLANYGLVGGEPQQTKQATLSDNNQYSLPFATSRVLENSFYRDLEGCNVAAFFSHGGTIDNRFQLRRGLDVWFTPGSQQYPFGSGNLRHLILNSCDSIESFKGKELVGNQPLTLFSEWMSGKFVGGLRTVCGIDGVATGVDRDGWRFFGRYNQGDSISDSWVMASVDECTKNAPTTVAYGSSFDEALQICADGRFSKEKPETKWALSSVWKSITLE